MSRSILRSALLVAAVSACGGDGEPYYDGNTTVQIGELDPEFEAGNAGGQEVTISGVNFGNDPEQVVVLMDNHNAEVLSVSNNEIVIRTPPGPITGGGVDILVANQFGYARRTPNGDVAPYTYGGGVFDGDGTALRGNSFYRDQRHYMQVTNLWDSCYGGRGIPACNNFSVNGQTGTSGEGEFFQFPYPRLHTTAIGWLTAFDVSPGVWQVGEPDAVFPNGIDDLRKPEMQPFTIVHTANEGRSVCVNMTEESGLQNATVPCDQARFDTLEYDLGRLEFCELDDQEDGGTGEFRADWPVMREFFEPNLDGTVDVTLESFPLQLVADLTLPPALVIDSERGFSERPTDPSFLLSPTESCMDSNDDGVVTLDEDGIVITWTPLDEDFLNQENVNTYLHISLTSVDYTWYGIEQEGVRASVVVPDRNEAVFDEDLQQWVSRVSVPNEVLYQLPTVESNFTQANDIFAYLGEYDVNPGLLWMEIYRVSDFKVPTNDGELIFSYSTGDMAIIDYSNPLDRDGSCGDCVDNDEDGWLDDLDPDCNEDFGGNGEDEELGTTEYTCNDGRDNNGDGLADADDPLCAAGWDLESTCYDGIDNDGDGWVDEVDPDCVDPDDDTQEDGSTSAGTCNDGLDNDGDGWVDAGDPACTGPDASEDDGFTGTACNDNVDSDGHGEPDHLDIYCILNGGSADREQPTPGTSCRNERDDDNDGFLDLNDPDCEYPPYNRERDAFHDAADPTKVLVPACYDNIDNDGDGLRDADDPSCWNAALGFAADGFLNDEGATTASGCNNGLDDDGDGWFDGDDPDCVAGSPDTQVEVGYGTTQCNDGIDNDGDGFIDSEDDRCRTAKGNVEG